MEKELSYYQILLGWLAIHMLKDEFKHLTHIIHTKKKLQWITELNIRTNAINVLQEYIGKKSS